MELQDITAELEETPKTEETQPGSDSQADTSKDGNIIATVDDVVEDKTETKADDGTETEEEKKEETPETQPKDKVEDEDDDTAFFEKPGVKKRIEGIESKYGSKASYWDTVADISKNDPEFRILMVQKLENAGKLPKGTAENLKAKLDESQKQAQETEKYVENLPPEIKADLEAARQLRKQQEEEKARKEKEVENFFLGFEKDKPDIQSSPNPDRVRNLIFGMASEMVDRKQADFKTAMDRAYNIVLHPDKITAQAKENGQVEAMVQASQEAASGITSGGTAAGKPVKMTEEEKRAAELIGISPEEYRKYKDGGDEIFENI